MTDDDDTEREVKNIVIRTNMLIRKFQKCSAAVKATLFKSSCLRFNTQHYSNILKLVL